MTEQQESLGNDRTDMQKIHKNKTVNRPTISRAHTHSDASQTPIPLPAFPVSGTALHAMRGFAIVRSMACNGGTLMGRLKAAEELWTC